MVFQSWNQESKNKISNSLKGQPCYKSAERNKKLSIAQKNWLKENPHSMLNKKNKWGHHTEETKQKMNLSKKGKPLSEEHKRKLSEIRKRKLKTGELKHPKGMLGKQQTKKWRKMRKNLVIPKKDTSIEVKIQNFLKKLGIEFFTHQYIKIEHGYQCDILIPAMNLVIECDGDYWHKYPIGNDIDHIRTKELIQKGFKVLRLWEFEIKAMDINKFKEKLKC